MRHLVWKICVLLAIWHITTPMALANNMIAELSAAAVIKSQAFQGREIVLSGIAQSNSNIVIMVQGPSANYRIWKKAKVHGLWVNHEGMILKDIPSFYFVAASRPIDQMINAEAVSKYNLDPTHLIFPVEGNSSLPNFEEFVQNFYHYKQRQRLFPITIAQVERIGAHLFRSYIYIPESAIIGTYHIKIYNFTHGNIVDQANLQFDLVRSTLDNDIDLTSHQRPLYYAAIAVLIALTTGAIAGYMFRNDR